MRAQTTTWEELDDRLDYFLSDFDADEDGNYIYAQPMRIASWNWAQRFVALHTPRSRETGLAVETGLRSAILPSDFLAVYRIYDAGTARWMRPMRRPQPGVVRSDSAELSQYWVWGGVLHFERTVNLGDTDITLYYWSYWPEVEYEVVNDEVEMTHNEVLLPPWAILPCAHLTAANLLVPGAIQAARIRNWNIRIDSGVPTDNIRATQAREHLFWYEKLMAFVVPAQWRDQAW
jgi:hypothetical protein